MLNQGRYGFPNRQWSDDITPSKLKMVADKIASTVSILFKESLSSGLLPTQFKMAEIFPL